MASRGVAPASFQRINPSRCAFNSSFSIKNLLNLPEENTEECVGSSNSASPTSGCPMSVSLVPRVGRPLVHYYSEGFSGGDLLNLRHFELAPPFQPWGASGPFREHGYPIGINMFQKRRRRPMRKKKQRPLFSPHQIQTMENEFAKQRYVTEHKRAQLASEVNLTETQVKTWFQNRRTKWRKENRDERINSSRMGAQSCSQDDAEQLVTGAQRSSFYQNKTRIPPFLRSFSFRPQFTGTATIPHFGMSLSFA